MSDMARMETTCPRGSLSYGRNMLQETISTIVRNLYSSKQQYPNMLPSRSWNVSGPKLIMSRTSQQICCAWSCTNQAPCLPPRVGLILPCVHFSPHLLLYGGKSHSPPPLQLPPPHSSTATDDSFGFWGKQGSQSPDLQRTRGDQATLWLRQSGIPPGSEEQWREMVRGLVSDLTVPSGSNSDVLSYPEQITETFGVPLWPFIQ